MSVYTVKAEAEKPKKANKLLDYRKESEALELLEPRIHKYGPDGKIVCDTDTVGYPTPENRSREELVVDSSEGFIPLWDRNVTLRWRFQEQALFQFSNVEDIKVYVRQIFGKGLLEWGDAVPIQFKEAPDAWDFEIVVMSENKCVGGGCTLASAFFPDAGRHHLKIYPIMFNQSAREQVETMAHELGHVFGLRHFFAKISETAWSAEIFGEHKKFSIMNYGHASRMTEDDRSDLKRLYESARGGVLTDINGTPIRLVKPFSANRVPDEGFQLIAAMEKPVSLSRSRGA